jgi:hypothetical protein
VSTYNFASLITLGFLIFIITFPFNVPIFAFHNLVKVNESFFNISSREVIDDANYGACEAGDYLYLVGYRLLKHSVNGKSEIAPSGYIEMRLKSNGSLVKEAIIDKDIMLYDCIIANDRLYAVSISWDILVLDLNLNLLSIVKRQAYSLGLVFSTTSYNNYLYIAGSGWRIEIWRIDDLVLVKEYVLKPDSRKYNAQDIGINPATEQIWVIGEEVYYDSFRAEILDLDLNLLKVIGENVMPKASGPLFYVFIIFKEIVITFSEDGYAYIGGEQSIFKYDKDGNIVKLKMTSHWNNKLLYANGHLYVGGEEFIEGYFRPVLYIYDRELNQIDRIILSWDLNVRAPFLWGDMIFDGKSLYITGWEDRKGYWGWILCTVPIVKGTSNITSENLKKPKCLIPSTSAESTMPLVWYIIGISLAVIIITLSFLWIKHKRTKLNKQLNRYVQLIYIFMFKIW